MKKIIFGIFAHPDDEAFGPSGTLLKETKAGSELHLITLTLGESGMNPDKVDDLASVRETEWREAGELIGANSMHSLGLRDNHLDNFIMLEAAEQIEAIVHRIINGRDCEVEFMSIDLNGITGHIDHIVAARAACLAFYRLRSECSQHFSRIRLACLPDTLLASDNFDWLYMEAGRCQDDINEVVDAREYQDELRAIIRAHHSQRKDGESVLSMKADSLGIDYFIVKT